ncbi:MAG TPA: hypothetical protein VFX70_22405 [Mycobacteriales bacterium]|nr:hypothetical protein [Mycobacteriales bacterium]
MQAVVAQTVDRLDMHGTAPALLLDLQGRLGDLAREALRITENGRRPFRPSPGWEGALAEVAFAVLSLADQTGIDLEQAVHGAVARMSGQPGGYPPHGGHGGFGAGPDPASGRGREPGRGFGHRGPGPAPGSGLAPGPGPDPDPRGPGTGRRNPPPTDDWPLSY